jgi:CBS domain-containing protein
MREKGVGGLPVMDTSGAKAIGNISIRDVQYLLTAPNIYKEHRFVILILPLLIRLLIGFHTVGTRKTIATDNPSNC